jgi:hypothetical protein
MQHPRCPIRQWATATVFAGTTAMAAAILCPTVPAIGGQGADGLDLANPWSGLPPSAVTGSPMLGGPPAAARPSDLGPCAPPLPCGTRLLGSVRKDGAVVLQVPAFRW